jgi:glycerol-1-phosphate dehydrogenase [NAD(P)+]
MAQHLPVYVGSEALNRLIAFCAETGRTHLALVTDENTYTALGQRAEIRLKDAGFEVAAVILRGNDIGADAASVYQVLLGLDKSPRTFIAVGSGTVTDVTRFVSHRSNTEFISLPTAASVDGYTSIGAPMIIGGAKVTVNCQGPLAVFGDLPALCAAPKALTAAGFGDLVAKLTSVSDWELGHVLWDEPFDPAIARRAREAVWNCADRLDSLAAGESEGVEALFMGLIESGLCMLDFGETRPASGYEHHVSHFWEMKLLSERRHSIYHGAKVGLGVLASARLYDAIRKLTADDVKSRIAAHPMPTRTAEEAAIRQGYGSQAQFAIEAQQPFLGMTVEQSDALHQRVIDRWNEVRRIATNVPPTAEMVQWLRRVGGATTPEELGLNREEYELGLRCGHYYRARFTIKKLANLLGL